MSEPLHLRLRRLREEAGLTQDELAERLGYSKGASISRIEKGVRDIPLRQAEAWVRACGAELALLPVGREGEDDGLPARMRTVTHPAARQAIATFARLSEEPERYWVHLADDISYGLRRALAAAARERNEA